MRTKIKVRLIGESSPLVLREVGDWIDLSVREDVFIKGPEQAPLIEPKKEGETKRASKRSHKIDISHGLLNLGVAMELPKGYEAWVLPRSSTPVKYSIELANSVGIIDNSYCGNNDEWKFYAKATADTYIEKGTRIAQFRIALSQRATFWQKIKWLFSSGIEIMYVDSLQNKDRGGIGSTGTN